MIWRLGGGGVSREWGHYFRDIEMGKGNFVRVACQSQEDADKIAEEIIRKNNAGK